MKILIVKTSALGDIIHAFPVAAYLRQKFPDAQIDWVVEESFAELVQSHPAINTAICIKSRAWRQALLKKKSWQEMSNCRRQLRQNEYDVVFDLQGNIKSGCITAQVKSKHKVGFGFKTVPEWPNTLFTNRRFNPATGKNIRKDYLDLVCRYFDDAAHSDHNPSLKITPEQHTLLEKTLSCMPKGLKKVMVCPGSAWPNKQMNAEALTEFLQLLQPYLNCYFLILWGSSSEKTAAQSLCEKLLGKASLIDKLPLQVLQNLMGRMDLVIAMDSLPLHLAGTTNVPTFSVFGASSAAKYKPEGKQHRAMQGACPYGKTFEKRCPILRTCASGSCIRGLTGQQVFKEFKTNLTLY